MDTDFVWQPRFPAFTATALRPQSLNWQQFGLELSPEDKRALIAFVKRL